MQANEVVLEGRHLVRSFGEGRTRTVALNDVSVAFHRSEIALIMGPSGSGKSTLLSVLSGLLHPDSGEVLLHGQQLWEMTASARKRLRLAHYGFIFQGYNLFPALTAYQQLEIVLRWGEPLGRQEIHKRITAMLELLGLTRQANLRPEHLSGGEKQRVAIGRALVKHPSICIVDEPTSALDWERGQQIVKYLCEAAHQRGATVVMVSHDHRLIPLVDRTLFLEDGRLKAIQEKSSEAASSSPNP